MPGPWTQYQKADRLAQFRQQYPQYNDMPDEQLADALHKKFYSDMPREDFNARMGASQGRGPWTQYQEQDEQMPIFEIQGDNGEIYEVQAPNEQEAMEAFNGMFAPKTDAGHNVPAFAPGVPGYNASTGMVERAPTSKTDSFVAGGGDAIGLGFTDELAAGVVAPFSDLTYDQALGVARASQNRARNDNPGTFLAGQLSGGLLQAGAMGPVGATARMGGAGLTRAGVGSAIDTAAIGGLYGLGSGETLKERLTGGGVGALAGGGLGFAAPYVVAGVGNAARRVITPFTTSPDRKLATDLLTREGVELSAGQRTGSEGLRYAESELGGKKAANLVERQGEQFTAAALRRVGTQASRATPEVMDETYTRIGQQFDELAARNTMMPDNQFATDMQEVLSEYGSLVAEGQRAPIIASTIRDISNAIKRNGHLPGESYKSLRSRLGRAARASKDPELKTALNGMNDAMDGAMERSIVKTNPDDAGSWRDVRKAYRNFLVLEDAASRVGAEDGIISAAGLRGATVNKQGRRNFVTGKGDFNELARAGAKILKPLPNSGTAGRTRAQNLGTAMVPAALGFGAGGYQGGDLQSALTGAAAGYMLPKAAGALLMSKPGQGLLGNRLLSGSIDPKTRKALTGILGAIGAPRLQERLR